MLREYFDTDEHLNFDDVETLIGRPVRLTYLDPNYDELPKSEKWRGLIVISGVFEGIAREGGVYQVALLGRIFNLPENVTVAVKELSK